MRKSRLVAPVLLLAGLAAAGCARRQPPPEPVEDPETRLGLAVSELSRGAYDAATRELAYVHLRYSPQPVGWKAMLLRIAAELDPRNEEGRPAVAARIAAHALESGARPDWLAPLAETLYLLAQDVAAPDSVPVHVVLPGPWALPADEADSADAVATVKAAADRPLPELPRPALAAQLLDTEAERERLARRVARLEEELARKDQELLKLTQELERIRKTLRP